MERIAAELAAEAAVQCRRPAAESAEAVHRSRLVIKRFRALLRLAGPALGKSLVRREDARLRRAAHRLAFAREASVGLATLDRLARRPRRASDPVHRVREGFAQSVHDAATASTAVVRGLTGVAKATRATANALGSAGWQRHGWDALGAGLRRGYRRARRRFKHAHTGDTAACFHDWRIAAKSLLYQVSLLHPAAPARLDLLLSRLDQLQAALGEEHDLAVLASRLEASPETYGGWDCVKPTLRRINARQQTLRKQALKLGRRLLARRPAEFAADLHRAWRRWRGR